MDKTEGELMHIDWEFKEYEMPDYTKKREQYYNSGFGNALRQTIKFYIFFLAMAIMLIDINKLYIYGKLIVITITGVAIVVVIFLYDVRDSTHFIASYKVDELTDSWLKREKKYKQEFKGTVANFLLFIYNEYTINGNLPEGETDWDDLLDFSGIKLNQDNFTYDKETLITNTLQFLDDVEAGIQLLKRFSLITEIKNYKQLLKLRPKPSREFKQLFN